MKTILVCNDVSEAMQSKAASVGLRLLVEPMIQVGINSNALPEIFRTAVNDTSEAWAFTSKNAVKAFQKLKDDLNTSGKKFFAVGHKTADGLKESGVQVTVPQHETATALAELIAAQKIKSVLFWCGNLRREELPALLRNQNISVTELVVYQTGLYPIRVTEHYDGVMFLSSSAVESFFSVNELPKHTPVFAIGDTTAHALKEYVKEKIITPEKPDMDLLLQCAHDYFSKHK
jgi:uroporphyrinogen-III synthase